jgi:cbb3-type cytochrome oxidase subunit 3
MTLNLKKNYFLIVLIAVVIILYTSLYFYLDNGSVKNISQTQTYAVANDSDLISVKNPQKLKTDNNLKATIGENLMKNISQTQTYAVANDSDLISVKNPQKLKTDNNLKATIGENLMKNISQTQTYAVANDSDLISVKNPQKLKVDNNKNLNDIDSTYVFIMIFLILVLFWMYKLTLGKKEFKQSSKKPSHINENEYKDCDNNENQSNDYLINIDKNIQRITDTNSLLQSALDKKDDEITRFKKGYDAQIVNGFLLRFTRVDQIIKEYLKDEKIDLSGLNDIHEIMEDALSECAVEVFYPNPGDDYLKLTGIAGNPKQVITKNEDKNLTVCDVIKVGYRRKLPDSTFEIITKARISIYIYKTTI